MRRNRWLRRGVYLLIFLLVLYGAFCWLLFNPLESSVENLVAFIPKDVSYLVHSSWGSLRKSRLYSRHVLESPIRGDVESAFEMKEFLFDPISEVESQINASLPSFAGKFSILDDVMGREILIAGNMTGPGEDVSEKMLNSPYVVLTRISTKAKFMDALKFSAVRDRIPNLKGYRDFFEYDIGAQNIRDGAPEEARYFFFCRIRDVLVLSNDRDLVQRVIHLGRASGQDGQGKKSLPRYWWFYYDFDKGEMPKDPGVSLWMRVNQSDRELGGELEGRHVERKGGLADFVRLIFPVGLTNTVSLHLSARDQDTLPFEGSIRMVDRESFPERIRGFHQMQGHDIPAEAGEAAALVPLERTFSFQWIRMAPADFLALFFQALDKGTKDLMFGGGADAAGGAGAWSLERTATEIGAWFSDGVSISVSRLPEVDEIDLDSFDGGIPLPLPAVTLGLTEKEHLGTDDLIQFFLRNHERFGFGLPKEIEVEGGRLFEMGLPTDMTLGLLKPGFAIVGKRLLFSTNVGELKRIFAVKRGEEGALASGERFQAALDHAWPKGNLFTFVDAVRVRPFLADHRWQAAYDATNFSQEKFRKNTFVELTRENPNWDTRRISEEAGRLLEQRLRRREEVEFPRAIVKYVNGLYWREPFEWLSLSTKVSDDLAGQILVMKGAIRMLGAEDE
jgi:hypothetical protein